MGRILSAYVLPHAPVIIPEIGQGREKDIALTQKAYTTIAADVAEKKPDTVIILTPHGVSLANALCITVLETLEGDFRNFARKDIGIVCENDLPLVRGIVNLAREKAFSLVELDEKAMHRYELYPVLDHGSMVPLYFVHKSYPKFKLVHISIGFIEKAALVEFGGFIRQAVQQGNSDCVLIASGDLSHKLAASGPYGYSKAGKLFDERVVEILKSGKLLEFRTMDEKMVADSAQCGLRSFITLVASMNEEYLKTAVLSYEAPFGVGYCVAKIENTEV